MEQENSVEFSEELIDDLEKGNIILSPLEYKLEDLVDLFKRKYLDEVLQYWHRTLMPHLPFGAIDLSEKVAVESILKAHKEIGKNPVAEEEATLLIGYIDKTNNVENYLLNNTGLTSNIVELAHPFREPSGSFLEKALMKMPIVKNMGGIVFTFYGIFYAGFLGNFIIRSESDFWKFRMGIQLPDYKEDRKGVINRVWSDYIKKDYIENYDDIIFNLAKEILDIERKKEEIEEKGEPTDFFSLRGRKLGRFAKMYFLSHMKYSQPIRYARFEKILEDTQIPIKFDEKLRNKLTKFYSVLNSVSQFYQQNVSTLPYKGDKNINNYRSIIIYNIMRFGEEIISNMRKIN